MKAPTEKLEKVFKGIPRLIVSWVINKRVKVNRIWHDIFLVAWATLWIRNSLTYSLTHSLTLSSILLCMGLYDYLWLCETLYDSLWLCVTFPKIIKIPRIQKIPKNPKNPRNPKNLKKGPVSCLISSASKMADMTVQLHSTLIIGWHRLV